MSRYFIISRLRWPALLLLTGVIALLDQMDILTWGHAWPLYLILLGVLALAERAALASEPLPPPVDYSYAAGYAPGYPAASYPAAGYPPAGYAPGYAPAAAAPPTPPASTGIVPAHTDLDMESGKSAEERRKSWEEEGK
jgi:hypothetical protein